MEHQLLLLAANVNPFFSSCDPCFCGIKKLLTNKKAARPGQQ